MLDIKYIKENPEEVIARLAKKGKDAKAEIEQILALDAERRALIAETESIKAEQNKINKLIPQYKKEGKDVAPIFAQMKEMSAKTKEIDKKLEEVSTQFTSLMLGLPNLPDTDLSAGGKENNEPLRYYGEPKKFDFEPKPHWEIGKNLGILDPERAAKVTGARFHFYKGFMVQLFGFTSKEFPFTCLCCK